MTDMTDSIRFYDRAIQRLTRRELLNIAWKLGVAAVAQPLLSTRAVRATAVQELSVYARRRVRRAVAGQRGLVDAARAGAAGGRRHADGQRRSRLGDCQGSRVRDAGVERDGRCPARARSQRPCRGERSRAWAASISIVSASAVKSARSAAPRRRHPPAPVSTSCASRCAAAATSRPGISPRSAGLRPSSSTSSSIPGITSTKGETMAGATRRSCGSIRVTRSTRSSTIAIATRSTRWIPIYGPRTPRRRSS